MRRFLYSSLLAFLIISCKSNSQSPENKHNKETNHASIATYEIEKLSDAELANYKHKLNTFFDSMLLRRNFNGGVLVAKGGNILYEQYIGYKNPKIKTDTIDVHTPFHLASTSKPFTGMAVLRLVQEGKIGLEDDIVKYFSGFPYSGVTVKDLLCHRSGLPNYLYFMEDKDKWNRNAMVSNNDVLDVLIKYQPPISYQPGKRFNYCNTNYVLLALIIEKVTGKTYPEYLKQTIFKPLHMDDTFVYTPADSGRVIMSYKPSGAVWDNDMFENTYGDKNIYSTPRDLLKWNNVLYNKNFIRESLLDSAYTPQSHEKPSIHNYGLGWRMLNLKNGKNVIYHFGKWHGFTPAFARLIDEKAVIIIVGNKYNKNIYEAAKHSYNIFGSYMQSEPSGEEEDIQLPTGPHTLAPIAPVKKTGVNDKKKMLIAAEQKAKEKKLAATKPKETKSVTKKPAVKKTIATPAKKNKK